MYLFNLLMNFRFVKSAAQILEQNYTDPANDFNVQM